jgi:hypothetical protein
MPENTAVEDPSRLLRNTLYLQISTNLAGKRR